MTTTETLRQQYQLTRGARAALFEYCEDVSPNDFVATLESFGHGSMRHLLVHVANVYLYWIGHNTLQRNVAFFKPEEANTMQDVEVLYRQVDRLVEDCFNAFDNNWSAPLHITLNRPEKEINTTPLAILTHVLTHEFHHKGQVLSMSRHLGYTPVDTDLIRF
ncbi:DinB family protein [Chryseolinea lacunae]|uniref:DinB family protein n=1 Tax=Chryseolinea lacunae TaxID=2801331 RepID=A0ABS1KSQ4_9BACT|nr:DinB family protein [Chryseolinea lacunae]MBL0742399.1 DinB family protein [Chryseolinea lacunae]